MERCNGGGGEDCGMSCPATRVAVGGSGLELAFYDDSGFVNAPASNSAGNLVQMAPVLRETLSSADLTTFVVNPSRCCGLLKSTSFKPLILPCLEIQPSTLFSPAHRSRRSFMELSLEAKQGVFFSAFVIKRKF